MKERIIYLVALMMTLFVMSACNNDDFPGTSEEFKDYSVVVKSISLGIEYVNSSMYQNAWEYGYKSSYECFYSLNELRNSSYASIMNIVPKIDWEKQTLIIARVYSPYKFDENGCNVYAKSNKYTIEYKVVSSFVSMIDYKGIVIILNQPNIKKEDVSFKVGIE